MFRVQDGAWTSFSSAALACLLLAGCDDTSKPSKEEVVRQVYDHFKGIFETDELHLEVIYLNGYPRAPGQYTVIVDTRTIQKKECSERKHMYANFNNCPEGTPKKGDALDQNREFVFIKTEQGWLMQH